MPRDRATLSLFDGPCAIRVAWGLAPLGVGAPGGVFLCAVHLDYLRVIYF